jgi:hypothetical protein
VIVPQFKSNYEALASLHKLANDSKAQIILKTAQLRALCLSIVDPQNFDVLTR